jgi:O-antigen/teichoic acid export membrane protein
LKESNNEQNETDDASVNEKKKNTVHDAGRSRMAKNVWIGWSAQFIYLIAGFVLPRKIDHSMGGQALGAWDFSWTLITYFGLVQAGVVSSVNRYIARYLAREDMENVNISASSVGCVLFAMALVIVLISQGA